jgi:NADH dehydrogenase [ubiquinone] 1 alpha subcomplex assembly factor 7
MNSRLSRFIISSLSQTNSLYKSLKLSSTNYQLCNQLFKPKEFESMTTRSGTNRFCHNLSAADVNPKELSLRNEIVQRIKACGPITVAEYMKMVLTHPISGFYMNRDVFGSKGHFTTSPEISQIFGELTAVWLLNEWQRYGCPKPFRVVEFGPGRGTLASDIARVLSQFTHSKDVTSLHLIEVSPHLTQIQEQTLCGTVSLIEKHDNAMHGKHRSLSKDGIPVTWYKSLDQMPVKPGFTAFIAHEFFDALPIHKFVRFPNGQWREVLIDFDDNKELRYVIANSQTPACKLFVDPIETSDNLEVCPQSAVVIDEVISRFSQQKSGCFLICDYGYDNITIKNRDTFRGFRDHQMWDPLKEPGTADLTADVDFGYLKRHIKDRASVFGTVTQEHFLRSLGIELRLHQLLENCSQEEKKDLESGVEMLLKDMGERYKFLALFPSNYRNMFADNPPAGFA